MTAGCLQIKYKDIGVGFKDIHSKSPSYPSAICPISPFGIHTFPAIVQPFFLEFILHLPTYSFLFFMAPVIIFWNGSPISISSSTPFKPH